MSFDLKANLLVFLREGARKLKEGNIDGLEYISRGLGASIIFTRDEDVYMMHHVLEAISERWLHNELRKEGGTEFLQKMGSIMEEISDAYASGDSAKLNSLLRKLVGEMAERWKQSPLLRESPAETLA